MHIIFESITSIEGTSDLHSEELRDTFSGSGDLGLMSIISGDTSALKKSPTTKRADIFKCTLNQKWTLSQAELSHISQ